MPSASCTESPHSLGTVIELLLFIEHMHAGHRLSPLPATLLNVLYLQEGIIVPILQMEKRRLTGVKKLILAVQFMSRSRVLV